MGLRLAEMRGQRMWFGRDEAITVQVVNGHAASVRGQVDNVETGRMFTQPR